MGLFGKSICYLSVGLYVWKNDTAMSNMGLGMRLGLLNSSGMFLPTENSLKYKIRTDRPDRFLGWISLLEAFSLERVLVVTIVN